jgi:tRNA(Ile)-lysidine synthase
VAHNADDQVETVLMHLLRGSGMAGLRGMQYQSSIASYELPITNHQLSIIRPLLDVTRGEIEAYCKENSLTPRFDRSNLDTTLFRNRLRHEVLPYLESINPRFRETLTRTSRSILDDYDYLERQASAAFLQTTHKAEDEVFFDRERWRQLHPALQRMTLRIAIQQLRSDLRNIDWTHIEDARSIALGKGTGAVATLPHGLRLVVGYDDFVIGDEQSKLPLSDLPQLNVDCLPLAQSGIANLPGSDWVVKVESGQVSQSLVLPNEGPERKNNWIAKLNAVKITGQLALRCRRAGDHFQPAGMGGHTKSIHEFMIDEKIPLAVRERLPLLVDGEKILWVCGFRMDDRVRVTDAARQVIQVSFAKKQNE